MRSYHDCLLSAVVLNDLSAATLMQHKTHKSHISLCINRGDPLFSIPRMGNYTPQATTTNFNILRKTPLWNYIIDLPHIKQKMYNKGIMVVWPKKLKWVVVPSMWCSPSIDRAMTSWHYVCIVWQVGVSFLVPAA